MKLNKKEDVKAWLRGLSLLKKDLESKSALYAELVWLSRNLGEQGKKHEEYYLKQVDELHQKIQALTSDIDKAMEMLYPEERAVLTARYIRHIKWEGIEFYVHYSKRQSIRIHERAIAKLMGMEVGSDVYRSEA